MNKSAADGGGLTAGGQLTISSEWLEDDYGDARAPEAPLDVMTRELGTIVTISCDDQLSTYVLNGTLGYRVRPDGVTIELLVYEGAGVAIDGPDRGAVEYALVAGSGWTGTIDAARRFVIDCPIRWKDMFNPAVTLSAQLQGNLLDNHRIAYLNTRISGLALSGTAEPARVLVDVPALM